MNCKIIACIDSQYGIGKDNRLPWHIPSELIHFRAKTMGQSCIVGNNTYKSLPKLKGRDLYVVSRSGLGLYEAIYMLNEKGVTPWVIGGQSIYEQALEYASEIHLSILSQSYECDAFFPKIELSEYNAEIYYGSQYDYMVLRK